MSVYLFRIIIGIFNTKLPLPTKRVTVILFKVKSCNALSCLMLVRINIGLKSVLKYKFLVLVTYHPYTLYLPEQGREDPWLFFEAERGPGGNIIWETLL